MAGEAGSYRQRLISTFTLPQLDQPLKDLFPPGLNSSFGSGSGGSQFPSSFNSTPSKFLPEQLHRLLTQEYNFNKHVEHTIVKSAWYAKQAKSAKHEFIIIEVQDTLVPDMVTNFVALDRNKGKHQTSQSISFLPSAWRIGADDAFRVSHDGNIQQLLTYCQLGDFKYLEQINFPPNDPLLLVELATLAHYVSERHPRYNAMEANCYWFAGLIWECMLKMHPEAEYINASTKTRGKFGWVRYIPNPLQVERVCEKVQKKLSAFKPRIPQPEYVWVEPVPGT